MTLYLCISQQDLWLKTSRSIGVIVLSCGLVSHTDSSCTVYLFGFSLSRSCSVNKGTRIRMIVVCMDVHSRELSKESLVHVEC